MVGSVAGTGNPEAVDGGTVRAGALIGARITIMGINIDWKEAR